MQEVNNEDGLPRFDRNSYLDEDQGGFQLLDLIVMEIKSHMTCYNSMPLIALVEITVFRLESKFCQGFF